MNTTPEDAEFVFRAWHEATLARDADAVAELYTPLATLESPLVPRLFPERGMLVGREQIHEFLVEAARRRPNPLVRLYRTGQYFHAGDLLCWEYPRVAPDGDQVELVELMRLDGARIAGHRIYWGWYGTELLIDNAVAKVRRSTQQP